MSSWAATKYKTTNWSAYNEALCQRGSLTIWFDPDMEWLPPPTGKRGRQQSFSDAAIQTCLTLKVLFGMVAIESAIGPSDNGDAPDNGFRRKLAAVGWFELDGTGLQHLVPPPEDTERVPALPGWHRPAEPSDR